QIADLKQGKYFAMSLHPGRYTFHASNGVPLNIDVHAGQDSFIRLDWNHGMDRSPIPVMTMVDATQARSEMRFLSYVDGQKIHSALVFKQDPTDPAKRELRTRDPQ